MDLLAQLAGHQLLVVTGKGGVGKTAISATLGRALAGAGRRVLVLEVDPRENVHQMLGVPPSGGAIVRVQPRLWVQNLKPRQVLDEIVRERLRVELLARRVLESAIYESFSAAAPGLRELAILGHAVRLLQGGGARPHTEADAPRLDLVVLDAPASGHGVRLLAAPSLVAEVIETGPFGVLAGKLAGFVADPARSAVVVVTQAEEMPVEETLELRTALREQLGREPVALVVNGLYPPLPPSPGAAASRGEAATEDELTTLWRRRREINVRELARLAESWPGPRVELPLLPLDRGPQLVAALERHLVAAGAAVAAASGAAGPWS
jgi:hypothetical protein